MTPRRKSRTRTQEPPPIPAIQRIFDCMALADLVALDREDRPILIVADDEKVARPEILPAYEEFKARLFRAVEILGSAAG